MSVYFDQLKEKFDEFYPGYQSWVKENEDNFPPDKIGISAFTVQEMNTLLFEFSDTIKIALENKEQCLKYISSGELQIISNNLAVILDEAMHGTSTGDYSPFANRIDTLIPLIRPLQLLSMEKMDEKRYREISDMDEVLSDIRKKQISFINADQKIQEGNKNLLNLIESTNQKNDALETLVNKNNQTAKGLPTMLENADKHANQIKGILISANGYKETIEGFVNLIQKREEQLSSQEDATKEYETKLNSFADRHKLSMKEAEGLIEEARIALKYTGAKTLSEAFQKRQEKLEDVWVKFIWLFISGISAVGAIGMGYVFFIEGVDNIYELVLRTILLTIAIGVSAFCSKQYAKNRSFEEDYAYKSALMASSPGLDEAFEQAGLRKEYAEKLLKEILQDPQRPRHDKEYSENNHSIAGIQKEAKKNIESVENIIDKSQPN